ncbi:helix-turn-helix domain-containing protein [Pandoraea sp. PE-S2T-3]|uniref:helix-turn-helix domain-containing protein n=1 Tax=Pandoraea sp. PE-S2T-3 TaxID=1986993 RepID=UPI000B401829|nr:helix-turn-helix domain-containing protein [Pandoraea sp. PE-S2T-3]
MPMSSFDLDDVTNLVQRQGIAARLSEQEKRLLVLLATHAGTSLDKRVLMEALWGRRAQWMEEAAIVQLVSRLRRSLAPLGLQRAIVTVARVGYRFDPPAGAIHTAQTGQTTSASPALDALPRHCVAREGHGEVSRNGIVVRIPQIEYRLLRALLSPPHVVHDKRTLIARLWPDRPDQDDTNLMQVVSRLRRKLIPLDLHRQIVTVPRMGYRFAPSAPTPATAIDQRGGARACDGGHWHTLRQRLRPCLHQCLSRVKRSLTWLTRHLRWYGR